ncbi:hypothetical protein [Singulisphaera sp. PoT]|uniref:hypothetical protein n=1 Tax=Singulisphaera sp. PoT TaxID=3411797 RepID=UPI003BF5D94E
MEGYSRRDYLQMALIASSMLWIKPLSFWLANTPWWIASHLGMVGLMFGVASWFLIPFALPIILLGPLFLFFRSYRKTSLYWLVASLLFVPAMVGGEYLSFLYWKQGRERLPRQSEPLIRAITAYETAHGRPPSKLSDLVPDSLSGIPSPPIGSYSYLVGKKAQDYSGNPWCLVVDVRYFPPFLFGTFRYYPRQNYPPGRDGASPQMAGDWVWVGSNTS